MDGLGQDTRYALRTLTHSRSFAAVAVLSLALGIAACTTIFSALDTLVLRALPFARLDQLVALHEASADCESCSTSAGDYATLRGGTRSFARIAASIPWTATLATRDGAERLEGRRVTPGFFALLGVAPALGRTFDAESLAPPPIREAVLGDRLWRTRFGGDPRVVGSTITLNGFAYTVTGVMPARFAYDGGNDVWIPLWFAPEQERDYLTHGYAIAARLAPNATLDGALRELGQVSRRIVAEHPEQDTGTRISAKPLSDALVGDTRKLFLPLLGGVGFVLLIVCANVASLTIARSAERRREIALRAAIGASRWRVARQLLAESALVAALGAALGAALAAVLVPVLRDRVPGHFRAQFPGWETLHVDGRALAFTAALGTVCALLAGVLPALRASRPDLTAPLNEGRRGSTSGHAARLRRTLVVAELALALVLLAGGGLMLRSLANLVATDTGFRADRTLTMALQVPARGYADRTSRVAFVERLHEAVGALPGVVAVAGTWNLPMSGTRNFTQYDVADRPPTPLARQPHATDVWVTPGYFAAMGMAMLQGRDFTVRDESAASKEIVVSRALARKVWPGAHALGHALVINETPYTVVGVVSDVRTDGVELAPEPAIYRSIVQTGGIPTALAVRTRGDPVSLTAAIRRALATVDPDAAIADVRTMPQVVDDYLTPWRLLAALLGAFAAIALVIAAVGIYGVMAYAVAQRTQEIGVRMALGADRGRILGMVVRQALALVANGAVLGVLGALVTARVLGGLLYGVRAGDVRVLGAAGLLLGAVALAAAWLPARRATRVDPLVALRAE